MAGAEAAVRDEILDLFDALRQGGRTLILVTHEEELARRGQRIVRLRDGRIESDEPVASSPPRTDWVSGVFSTSIAGAITSTSAMSLSVTEPPAGWSPAGATMISARPAWCT